MMNEWAQGLITGIFATAIILVMAVIIPLSLDGNLRSAQKAYSECIRLGAPQDNCLKEYLLPKAVEP